MYNSYNNQYRLCSFLGYVPEEFKNRFFREELNSSEGIPFYRVLKFYNSIIADVNEEYIFLENFNKKNYFLMKSAKPLDKNKWIDFHEVSIENFRAYQIDISVFNDYMTIFPKESIYEMFSSYFNLFSGENGTSIIQEVHEVKDSNQRIEGLGKTCDSCKYYKVLCVIEREKWEFKFELENQRIRKVVSLKLNNSK